eukprot:790380-Amphidinium_carterae.1
MALPPVCGVSPEHGNRNLYSTDCITKPELIVRPTVLVSSKGYAKAEPGSELDSRFEIHSVSPTHGSTEGGAYVTLTGIGFSSPEVLSLIHISEPTRPRLI